jgi:hypothetical protein
MPILADGGGLGRMLEHEDDSKEGLLLIFKDTVQQVGSGRNKVHSKGLH